MNRRANYTARAYLNRQMNRAGVNYARRTGLGTGRLSNARAGSGGRGH